MVIICEIHYIKSIVDSLFVKLNRGLRFTTSDLDQACQQLELEEESHVLIHILVYSVIPECHIGYLVIY